MDTGTTVVAGAIEDPHMFAKPWEPNIRTFQGRFVFRPDTGFNYDFNQRLL